LAIYGTKDPVVPPPNPDILGPLDSGHFVWNDKAEEYSSVVLAWINGGYRQV